MALGKLKRQIKANKSLSPIYESLRAAKNNAKDSLNYKRRVSGKRGFEDRSKGSDRLCIVLAGYKEYLYPAVFGRLNRFAPKDIDICILTSGRYSNNVAELCAENGWSYLYTRKNNVSLIQNIAIDLHPFAEYIFKLDEDIFVTEGYFENMLRAYHHAENGDYIPGVLAPLIPINGYGHMRILEKLELVDEYTKLFEKPKYTHGNDRLLESNVEAAQYFWGVHGSVPSIDEMNARFSKETLAELPCAIRFSIGAIMFKRSFWKEIKLFPTREGNMATDEKYLCRSCCTLSRPLMVSENVVVGHLAFGPQNAAMKEFYLSNTDIFV